MNDHVPPALVSVLASPPEIAAAIPCFIWRAHSDRLPTLLPGTIHANTFASVNLILEGRVRLESSGNWLPDVFVTGPFTRPVSTLSASPFSSLVMVLEPRLLGAWFGLRPKDMVDSTRDATGVLHPPLRDILHAVAAAPATLPDAAALLAPLIPPPSPALTTALVTAGSVRDAARHLGYSERHFHRQFVEHHGLSPMRWLTLRRFENSLVNLAGPASLAATAANSGYADQPHMSRAFRSHATLTPAAARHIMAGGTGNTWSILAATAVDGDNDDSR